MSYKAKNTIQLKNSVILPGDKLPGKTPKAEIERLAKLGAIEEVPEPTLKKKND